MIGNNTEKYIATLAAPFQSLERMLQQLLTQRYIDTAVGAQLDVIGRIVGQRRNGLVDADYRRYCRARIAASNSNGIIEDLISVTSLIVYDNNAHYEIANQTIATVVVRVQNLGIIDNLSDILIKFLKQTVSAGVRVILEYFSTTPGNTFKWDTAARGWDTGCKFLTAKA